MQSPVPAAANSTFEEALRGVSRTGPVHFAPRPHRRRRLLDEARYRPARMPTDQPFHLPGLSGGFSDTQVAKRIEHREIGLEQPPQTVAQAPTEPRHTYRSAVTVISPSRANHT